MWIKDTSPQTSGAAAEEAAVKAERQRRMGWKSIKYIPTSQIKSPVKLPTAKTQVWRLYKKMLSDEKYNNS